MKKYITPNIDMLVILDVSDVITTSNTLNTIDGLTLGDGNSIDISVW